ncbi:MAG TPA: TlpA disulfide reductase family protein [Jatrophihabitans sp.]|nr:TlpA disulfide reductase family protein [Jatrophihabitans sp.]
MKRVCVLLAAAAILLSACTGSNAVDQNPNGTFKFTSGTALGTLYPQADRKKAGDFTAPLLDGGKTSLATTKGKIVVLNYWASWCTPCRTETPQFDLLYRKIKNQGVEFLGIDTKDEKSDAEAFVKQNDISFPTVYDEQGETAIRLGNIPQTALPFTVLIDKQGKVAAVYKIALSAKDLQRAIVALQAEH